MVIVVVVVVIITSIIDVIFEHLFIALLLYTWHKSVFCYLRPEMESRDAMAQVGGFWSARALLSNYVSCQNRFTRARGSASTIKKINIKIIIL